MQDLFSRIAGAADTSEDVARQSVAHILAFMQVESDSPAVGRMVEETPGAKDAIESTAGADGEGGIMGLGAKLMGLGLDMGQIRQVAEELITVSKAQSGDETVDEAISSVPALAQFV